MFFMTAIICQNYYWETVTLLEYYSDENNHNMMMERPQGMGKDNTNTVAAADASRQLEYQQNMSKLVLQVAEKDQRITELEQQLQLAVQQQQQKQEQDQEQDQQNEEDEELLNYHKSPRLQKYEWLTDDWISQCASELTLECANGAPWCVPFYTAHRKYCMGDCIKNCGRCHRGDDTFIHPSFARNYSNLACGRSNPLYRDGGNLDVLVQLMEQMKQYQPQNAQEPPTDAIVLHLRLGDIIERSYDSIETILTRAGDPYHTVGYEKSIKSVYEYLDNIEESGANHVVVVGGSQFPI